MDCADDGVREAARGVPMEPEGCLVDAGDGRVQRGDVVGHLRAVGAAERGGGP